MALLGTSKCPSNHGHLFLLRRRFCPGFAPFREHFIKKASWAAGGPRLPIRLPISPSFTAHFSSIIFLLHDVFLSFPGSAAGNFRRRQRSILRRDVPDMRAFDPACRTTPFPHRPLAVTTNPFDNFRPIFISFPGSSTGSFAGASAPLSAAPWDGGRGMG